MSIVTKTIGLAKKMKHRFAAQIKARTPVYLSPVRKIERVAYPERVCAMTFDDGPCRLPAEPDTTGKPLTAVLLETLEKYGAKGTFDIVGDTSKNYPDRPGKEGSASWGGVAYDHYPDFGRDADGGAKACPELVQRILSGGHEITSHTWSHVLYGPKPLVYGGRKPLEDLDAVIKDLRQLHDHMKERYGYEIKLSRPPHYVDNTKDGFSAYDAHAHMGYQYLCASFDGAGWLPLASYEAEVEAMYKPMELYLASDPDYFCGQIIFQKDGYNMARRSPVANGLEKQLALLAAHGYRIVTVSDLLALCPFSDLAPAHPVFAAAKGMVERGYCVCYRDNTVRPDAILTRGELAMLVYGGKTAARKVEIKRARLRPARDVGYAHPYAAAVEEAMQAEALCAERGRFYPDRAVSAAEFAVFCRRIFGKEVAVTAPITHGKAIEAIWQAERQSSRH